MRKFDFDHHSITVRPSPSSSSSYDVSVGDASREGYKTTVTPSHVSSTEMISQFPHTRAQSTFIPLGTKLHVFASDGRHYTLTQSVLEAEADEAGGSAGTAADRLTSPMPATVIEVRVKPGDKVTEGQVCCVLESMKMEISIRAGRDGEVSEVGVDKGQTVEEGMMLVALKSVE